MVSINSGRNHDLSDSGGDEGKNKRYRILLVEDSKNNQMLFKAFLKPLLCQIEIASDGKAGLDRFKDGHFNLVLMDIFMPVMNGLEATSCIRKWEVEHNAGRTPVLAITAVDSAEDREKSIKAGCDELIGKPVGKEKLLKVVEKYLKHAA